MSTQDIRETRLTDSDMSRDSLPILYVMIGVSGSGKSSFVENIPDREWSRMDVVSTDAIREILFGSEEDQSCPASVFLEAYDRMNCQLKHGFDVIFDATNTTTRGRKEILKNVSVPCRKVAVLVMTPLEIALERNSNRRRHVPEDVIKRQYEQLLRDGKSIPEQFDDIIFVKREG